jgi:hypothetical protein
MATPYIHERQSEYWTSRQVEEFFLDLGFEVMTLPLTQLVEHELPADFIFFDKKRSKLFGFQYKALYKNKEDYWPINSEQHAALSDYPWVYYCLSELRRADEHRIALHLTRIIEPRFSYQEKLFPRGEDKIKIYSRWGAFYQGLEKCYNGIVVKSPQHLKELILQDRVAPNLKNLATLAVDVFLADLDSKNMIHYSPSLIGGRGDVTE